MSSPTGDPAQAVIDAVFYALQYICERCPRDVNKEMEDRLLRILTVFDRYRLLQNDDSVGDPCDLLFDSALGRNHMIAQISALLIFANDVGQTVEAQKIEPIASLTNQLWTELKAKYNLFYAELAS